MRGPQVIDLRDASRPQRIRDAPEVPVTGVAGVHQQRLTRRADEQCRLPALGVDVINRQRSGSRLRGSHQNGADHTADRDYDSAHACTPRC
jgi:hypothetical protein